MKPLFQKRAWYASPTPPKKAKRPATDEERRKMDRYREAEELQRMDDQRERQQ